MTDVVDLIERALAQQGISAAAASQRAVGNPSLIKNMKKGQGRFSFDNLERLAKVLGYECYFGPPRPVLDPDALPPLSPRLLAALLLPEDATEADALARIAGWPKTGHKAASATKALVDEAAKLSRSLSATQDSLAAILTALRAGLDAPMLGDDQKE